MEILIKPIMTLEEVEFYKYLKSIESPFLNHIEKLVEEKTIVLANEIPKVFDTYTIHDISHSFRLLQHCYSLVHDNIDELNELDIVILFFSAVLHDIGMAVSSNEIEQIQNTDYSYNGLKYSAMLKQRDGNEKVALQDFIRTIHASRANDYVQGENNTNYLLPNQQLIDFRDEVGKVCLSHGKDFSWIIKKLSSETMKGTYSYNLQFCSFLLRLGDLLDFDGNRTPPILYKMIEPIGYGGDEWKQHFMIKNFQKIHINELNQKTITIIGESIDAKIHRKFLQYLKWIENEVSSTINATKSMQKKYHLNLNPFLDIQIETKGYTFSDKKLSIDYQAITKLLMGEKIYGDKKLALREIIQNSIDACKIRQEFEKNKSQYGDDEFNQSIKIIINKIDNNIIIKDNGMGMSMEIVNNYFLNVGKSYYTSESFLLEEYAYKPIGNFGIGFLACFMLSDEVIIKTRYINSERKISIALEKESEYITISEENDVQFSGTEIIFNYMSFMEAFDNDMKKLIEFTNTLFLTDDFQINIIDFENKQTFNIESTLEINNENLKNIEYIFSISKYLNGIEGNVKIKYIDKYINNLSNIESIGSLYVYENSILKKVDDNYDLSHLFNDDKFEYITIPIISDDEKENYEKYYDTFEDYEEAIDKVSDETLWITIFYNSNKIDYINNGIIESGDYIIDEIPFDDLVEFGQDEDCKTKIYTHTVNSYYDGCYIPFGNKRQYFYFYSTKKQKIYLRNIFISNYTFKANNEVDIYEIEELKLNITNRNIIPSISRNDFDKETNKKLNYAINKAIHLSALDNLKLDSIKKSALKSFINSYFKETTDLE
ncbi:MAG: ATP-binding protein [Arcobacteraceae bacterium]|nr:ATP-binding protein [Arcobacteraceae bacterium]